MNDQKAVIFVTPAVGIAIVIAMVAAVSFAVVTLMSAVGIDIPFGRVVVICGGLMAFSAATSLLRPAAQDKDSF